MGQPLALTSPPSWVKGPWMWGPRADVAVFGGSAAVALALVALAPALGRAGSVGPWTFLILVVGIDVAHVYSTLFRTYFDRAELGRRPFLYAGVPAACFVVLTAVSLLASKYLWTVLAYLALFHFVRQQAGWVAIYRARARAAGAPSTTLDRVIDDGAIYASTLVPVFHWHANLPRNFVWFIEGDFLALPHAPWMASFVNAAFVVLGLALFCYLVNAVRRALRHRCLELGKHAVVLTTAATWFVGIVGTNGDFTFTAANVIPHGVPYLVFLYVYARRKADHAPTSNVAKLLARGAVGFVALLVAIAFFEELLWDRLVWHSHAELFGFVTEAELTGAALTILVPLLMVPQATHYVLDAVLWRRKDTSSEQARAMGFAPRS